ncbi:hypothetical protein JCM5296_005679 [Sporobolomyces johnsonii]
MKSFVALSAAALLASSVVASSHHAGQHDALHRRMARKQAGLIRRSKRSPAAPATAVLLATPNTTSTHSASASQPPKAADGNYVINGTALWFYEDGSQGACGEVNTDDDLVMGLSDVFWNNTGVHSQYCGQSVIITNTNNGKNVTVKVADASGKEYTTLTRAAFLALEPLSTGMIPIQYHFLNSTSSANSTSSSSHVASSTSSGKTFESSAFKGALAAVGSSTAAPTTTSAAPTTSAYDSSSAAAASQAAASAYAASVASEQAASSSAAAAAASSQAAAQAAARSSAAAAAASSKAAAQAAASSAAVELAASVAAAAASSKAAAVAAAASSQAAAAAAAASASASSSSGSSGHTYSGGSATFFYQNGVAGNCGQVNSDQAMIVALPTVTYAGGSHCGQTVTITRVSDGKTINAKVADSCPTCDNNSCLDLSVGAFQALGGTVAEGMFPITWSFN